MVSNLPDDARCLNCGYRLHSLPENRCPECGKPFDPAVQSTYRSGSSPRYEKWTAPPGWAHVSATILLTLNFLFGASSPGRESGMPLGFDCLAFPIALVLLGTYGFKVLTRLHLRKELLQSSGEGRTCRRWRWTVLPLCAAVIWSSGYTNWPLKLRFGLSRNAFQREVSQLVATSPLSPGGHRTIRRWVGSYWIDYVCTDQTNPGSICFVTGHGFGSTYGFAFAPSGQSRMCRDIGLGAPWYMFLDLF